MLDFSLPVLCPFPSGELTPYLALFRNGNEACPSAHPLFIRAYFSSPAKYSECFSVQKIQTRRLHESNANFSTLGAHNLELMGKAHGVGGDPGEPTTGMSGTRTLFINRCTALNRATETWNTQAASSLVW
jgi:hypothetical protein